ncbi:C40 family peptidase [Olsenella sp. HMSC062G07]|uniref:C40 family peptidase n=1 Tax=Olsenella sp. HMSC062G07 TaxID=1739330 RepID=UPI000A65393E|nr:C40 family peptidase [Olsenella sp. HMSC062G07]
MAGVTRRQSIALAAGLVLSTTRLLSARAHAEPQATQETLDALSGAQSRLDAAEDKLNALGAQLEELAYKQDQTQAQLDDTQRQIDGTQDKIDESTKAIAAKQADVERSQRQMDDKRRQLGKRVAATYTSGGISMLDIVLNSSSLDDLASSIYYSDKIAQAQNEQIESIRNLKAQLERQRSELERQKSELESQKADLEAQKRRLQDLGDTLRSQRAAMEERRRESQRVVDGLDQDVKDLMAKRDAEIEAAREEEQRKAAAAAAAARQGQASGTVAVVATGLREQLCNAALSLLGVPYVWGGTYPQSGGTDCSGLMQWAFAQCGYAIPRTTYTQLAACRSAGHVFYDTSQLQPGDLVFVRGGHHVAMYLGNGSCVHEPHPGASCMVSPLSRWNGIYALGFPLA